jgi:dTDP-4-amino-4,6-dideoxygalactose transaminase
MINIFQPALGKEELEEISKVFTSNWVGKGEDVDKVINTIRSFRR